MKTPHFCLLAMIKFIFGAVAHHAAQPLLKRLHKIPTPEYTLGWGALNAERVQQHSGLGTTDADSTVALGLLSIFPQDRPPTLFRDRLLIVLLGQLDNRLAILDKLEALGYDTSNAPTEWLLAALIDWHLRTLRDLRLAVQQVASELEGHLAVLVASKDQPDTLIAITLGPELYLAQHPEGQLLASEPAPLRELAATMQLLMAGECAELTPLTLTIWQADGQACKRAPQAAHAVGQYLHHMQADMQQQPLLLAELAHHAHTQQLSQLLNQLARGHAYRRVLLLASGSSHHAAMLASQWFEAIAGLPARYELASEYRSKLSPFEPDTLVVALSQSGETADTLAALQLAIQSGHQHTIAISNNPFSRLMRLASQGLPQFAGPEAGATSTKTFSSQLVVLYSLALALARGLGRDVRQAEQALRGLGALAQHTLQLEPKIKEWAQLLHRTDNLFITGRQLHWPIALEGAQKLKEIAYQHAEGYPGGELKHGPVTLINRVVPVIACLPWDHLADKMLANLQEVRARHGMIFILSDAKLSSGEGFYCLQLPKAAAETAPILYALALQLLSYHCALLRGNHIDRPRYLSKAQTSE
ncbi:SIS domain-containing protein [Chitinibacter tainanensis]|uniref:SIS domain-containing protein n=1 Tax=Chitinibacter tainanensis TaxID=230667 RepID=UPI00040FA29B|nr:SIS domain-containing protein [Chitinibacter tainanensis]